MQAKLLRVLQDREVRRVGGSWSKLIDVRMIASTNQHLRELVDMGKFRADLYYRLNVAYLFIPPLRRRQEDIPALLEYFTNQINMDLGLQCLLSKEVIDALQHYEFPGNVREMRNLIEGLFVSAEQATIELNTLPSYITKPTRQDPIAALGLAEINAQFEKQVIEKTLLEEGSIRKAAKKLKLSHSTLIRKMRKYEINFS